jgi:ferric-dicitrate binding protein FerR (iron transport regulator)
MYLYSCMAASDLKHKLEQYLADTLPETAFQELWNSLQDTDDTNAWHQAIEEVLQNEELHGLSDAHKRAVAYQELRTLLTSTEPAPAPVVRVAGRPKWMGAAAAVFILLLAGGYLLLRQHYWLKQPPVAAVLPSQTDIMPGTEGAILTLADGTQVVLDSLGNGVVATQNGAKVVLANGQLSYVPVTTTGEVAYNTVTTPKGRQFTVLLPDGSRVWLNAGSALRYPTLFTGSERKVEVSGEAYFEVTANAVAPFKVQLAGQEIEVLGTAFNVNAYADEASISTTLLEGAVRIVAEAAVQPVNAAKDAVVLKPGTQSQIFHQQPGKIKVVTSVNTEQVVAWKNGAFNFNDKTLEEVLRQLARWYDVEVVYEGDVPYKTFYGEMGRTLTLSECLKVLEKMQVHFRIEAGRRLVVMQ